MLSTPCGFALGTETEGSFRRFVSLRAAQVLKRLADDASRGGTQTVGKGDARLDVRAPHIARQLRLQHVFEARLIRLQLRFLLWIGRFFTTRLSHGEADELVERDALDTKGVSEAL